MSLALRCPACKKRMAVPEHAIGRRVECPRCENVFRYTGQRELTLGRVRRPGAAPIAAPMASPVAAPVAAALVAAPILGAVPMAHAMPVGQTPVAVAEMPYDMGQTQPVIDLPQLPQSVLDQLPQIHAREPEPAVMEVIDHEDLEIFHSVPVESQLPEVTEAEIEALFNSEPDVIEEVVEVAEVAEDPPMPLLELPERTAPAPVVAEEYVDAMPVEEIDEVMEAMPVEEIATAEPVMEAMPVEEIATAEPVMDMVEELDAEPVMEAMPVEEIATAEPVMDVVEELDAEPVMEAMPFEEASDAPMGWAPEPVEAGEVLEAEPVAEVADAWPVADDLDAMAAVQVQEFADVVEEIPEAAPIAQAMPVAGMPVAGIPMAGVPMAGVIRAAPVAGVPVAGVPMAGVPVAGIPMAGLPVAGVPMAAAMPVSQAPIPPPTPSTNPMGDEDLDALFREVLDDTAAKPVEELPMEALDVTMPIEEIEAIAEVEEIVDAEIAEPIAEPVAVEAIAVESVDDDLEFQRLFEDEVAEAAPADLEPVDDVEYLFEDDPPAGKK